MGRALRAACNAAGRARNNDTIYFNVLFRLSTEEEYTPKPVRGEWKAPGGPGLVQSVPKRSRPGETYAARTAWQRRACDTINTGTAPHGKSRSNLTRITSRDHS